MDFKKIVFTDIEKYCEENNQNEWLYNALATKVEKKVYPTGADGKPDKTATPTIELHEITFVELKRLFCEKFMPELVPEKKTKKNQMQKKLEELKAKLGK